MKARLHITTGQYEFIEMDVEAKEDSIGRIVESYFQLKNAYEREELKHRNGFGLDTKEFNAALDRYLTDGTGETETYMKMSKEQQWLFQEIKKSVKRIKNKNQTDTEPIIVTK